MSDLTIANISQTRSVSQFILAGAAPALWLLLYAHPLEPNYTLWLLVAAKPLAVPCAACPDSSTHHSPDLICSHACVAALVGSPVCRGCVCVCVSLQRVASHLGCESNGCDEYEAEGGQLFVL